MRYTRPKSFSGVAARPSWISAAPQGGAYTTERGGPGEVYGGRPRETAAAHCGGGRRRGRGLEPRGRVLGQRQGGGALSCARNGLDRGRVAPRRAPAIPGARERSDIQRVATGVHVGPFGGVRKARRRRVR